MKMKHAKTIRIQDASVLHTVAEEIALNTDVHDLMDSLWSTMYWNHGQGLAANQIGELKRAIVVHPKGFRQEFINPVITKYYGGQIVSKEGCLSFPGQIASIIRYRRVIVEGYDRNWIKIRRKLRGDTAIVVQHEVDHLNGMTIIQRSRE